MNKRIRIKTKPNLKILILFSVILFLGLTVAFTSMVIDEVSIQILLIIIGTLLFLLSIVEFIKVISNYEEIDNNYLIVHGLSRRRTIPINEIKQISFNGMNVKLLDNNELVICNIDPNRDNLFSLLEVLKNNGIEYVDNSR